MVSSTEKDAETAGQILQLCERFSHRSESLDQALATFRSIRYSLQVLEREIQGCVLREMPDSFRCLVHEVVDRVRGSLSPEHNKLFDVRYSATKNRTVRSPSGRTFEGDFFAVNLVIPDVRWLGESQSVLFIHVPELGTIFWDGKGEPEFLIVLTVDGAFDMVNQTMGGRL